MKSRLSLFLIIVMFMLAGCDNSDSSSDTTSVNVPGIPTGLSVIAKGLTSLTLSWDVVSDATSYTLYRSESASGTYSEIYSGAAAGFIENNLVYATTYYYQVSASNSGGESDTSTAVSETTEIPDGFTVTGSPSGGVDYTYSYLEDFNSKPRYQSNPIGYWISVPISGNQGGLWVFYDQIEQMNVYYHPTASDYPPQTGWLSVLDDTETTILLTPFKN